MNGKFAGISKEQIEACNDMIERRKEQMDWVLYVNRRFCELTGKVEDGARWMQKGTVEYCLSAFVRIMGKFANRLDALLLVYGIDLMRLQEVSGLYIKSYRQIADIYIYIGSWELAQRYINALPKQIESNKEVELANESQQELQKEIYKISLPSETNEKASKRGRQSRSFESCLIDDDISKLEALRNIMNGKKGKEAALVIKVAVKIGWITKPTYQAVVNEFGDIGHRSNYNKYINENKFTNDEIEGMKAKLIAE